MVNNPISEIAKETIRWYGFEAVLTRMDSGISNLANKGGLAVKVCATRPGLPGYFASSAGQEE